MYIKIVILVTMYNKVVNQFITVNLSNEKITHKIKWLNIIEQF